MITQFMTYKIPQKDKWWTIS